MPCRGFPKCEGVVVVEFFPVVSVVSGVTVAGANHEHNAEMLVRLINRDAGAELVRVGAPVPMNPGYRADVIAELIDAVA